MSPQRKIPEFLFARVSGCGNEGPLACLVHFLRGSIDYVTWPIGYVRGRSLFGRLARLLRRTGTGETALPQKTLSPSVLPDGFGCCDVCACVRQAIRDLPSMPSMFDACIRPECNILMPPLSVASLLGLTQAKGEERGGLFLSQVDGGRRGSCCRIPSVGSPPCSSFSSSSSSHSETPFSSAFSSPYSVYSGQGINDTGGGKNEKKVGLYRHGKVGDLPRREAPIEGERKYHKGKEGKRALSSLR